MTFIYNDLNIHLPTPNHLAEMLAEDLKLEGPHLITRLDSALNCAGPNLTKANIMLFNQFLSLDNIKGLVDHSNSRVNQGIYYTLLASPLKFSKKKILESYALAGISAIKFHSYQQNIETSEFDSYLLLAKWAEELHLPIFIDASYGSLGMYKYDNLKLVAEVASLVKTIPIIILHSGGSRAIQAMLLAESAANIFLEMSYSIPYYSGSSIEKDLAFAYKKIGVKRVIYASDHPYITHKESLTAAIKFCEANNFGSEEQDWLFRKSFSCIFESYTQAYCPEADEKTI